MTDFQERLVFVVSPPRAGSTLLQRMLGSHSQVATHPEPHLITPLAFLGYHDRVDAAPYDHVNAAEAIRLFVDRLPRGEADYLDALRAYADHMYERMLEKLGGERFVDKTPAYALVLPFLTRLYPRARYVVLTRHPLAVFSSYANSFFQGDWATAHRYNPLLERYVPAMARLLRERPVPLERVAYEELVRRPAETLARLFRFLGLPDEPEAVHYGERFDGERHGPGDPMNVDRQGRPTGASLDKWVKELRADASRRRLAEQMVARLAEEDLEAWGWPREQLWAPLREPGVGEVPRVRWSSYTLQRQVLLWLRKDVHRRPHGKLLRRVRYYCDAILRDTL